MNSISDWADWKGFCDGCRQKKTPEEMEHWGPRPTTAYYCRQCWRSAQRQVRLRFAVAFSVGFVVGIVVALLMVSIRLS